MNNFESASIRALTFLRQKLGFQLCMVTRAEGNDWTVLHSDDKGYGVVPGDVFNWDDSFCCEMVKGLGPNIAADANQVPAYAAAEIGRKIPIGAYIGVPLRFADGRLFGTLCGIDPSVQPDDICEHQELIEVLGEMLSTILQMELRVDEEERRAERFQAQALTDALTGLYNRGGWEQLLAKEEARYQRYRQSSVVIVVDLDELKTVNDLQGHAAGDSLIKRAASALQAASRSEDVVARLGGDEFGIIGVGCDLAAGHALCSRLEAALDAEGIKASYGLAVTTRTTRIAAALTIADNEMYEQKRQKKAADLLEA
ncbi:MULTISPECIES: sensor domain-containing diguanylate cyclase [Pseudomonas]|uniref:sensor domain-containing diguanylate cyclase n=1 Tax=Pseudomonas TaxID=286 RepID=UPI0005706CB6|nr:MULTISPECIES: sensor domain-containing diguanylate cyclase [Pseudomonas]QUN70145.1 sensor domain-containing diguanylate cyclase [Pseudomonas sp. JS425]